MDAKPLPSPDLLRGHVSRLEQGLLERGTAVRLVLLAALAGEHVLLIGPPGTAKSELARRLHRSFDSAPYFERLLTRFSTPEELFGPLSLKALEDDRYERLTDGYLPTAGIAFLDEVFKANSAILNALLTLLNEREFDNGTGRRRTPLLSVIGAANEAPADESLQAFHDRFLLRVPTRPVGDASFETLLRLDDLASRQAGEPAPLTAADCAEVARRRGDVPLSDGAVEALKALRAFAATHGLPVSDRRWRQLVALMRSAALTEGRAEVDAADLWLSPFVVCPDDEAMPMLAEWVDVQVIGAQAQDAPWLTRAVEAFEQQLRIEERLPADGADDSGAGKVALARSLGAQGGDDEMLRIRSALVEERARHRFSPVHVQSRLAQVDEVAAQAEALRAQAAAALQALQQRLQGRLWTGPEAAQRWCAAHGHTLQVLDGLLQRLAATRAGFAALPQDDRLPDTAPQPVALE